jgi:hypothetical protein
MKYFDDECDGTQPPLKFKEKSEALSCTPESAGWVCTSECVDCPDKGEGDCTVTGCRFHTTKKSNDMVTFRTKEIK